MRGGSRSLESRGCVGNSLVAQWLGLCAFTAEDWSLTPGGSDGKESACNAGYLGSIPGSGRLPGEGNGYTLQYSCLENSMEREAWWVTVMFMLVVTQNPENSAPELHSDILSKYTIQNG